MTIKLLDFFRNASFGGIKVGFDRDEIEAVLGKPDFSAPGHSSSENYRLAGLWYYAGMQFNFSDLEKGIVDEIAFRPGYLDPKDIPYDLRETPTVLDRWIWGQVQEPTIEELSMALADEGIPFQDTGLETCIYDKEKKRNELVPYDPTIADAESFGTFVLRSGVQVRYDEDSSLICVSSGAGWMIKGKEQFICWVD